MHRRTILTGLAAAVPIGLAGCTGGAGGGGGGTDTTTAPPETDTSTESRTPGIQATLTPREECPNPGEATVSFDTDELISIVGCVVGKNGCVVPRLAAADYDSETRALTVVVAAVEERDNETACTQQIVHLGYEVELTEAEIDPTSVEVVHDDRNGRRTVEDVTR
jgi:hypothetical protein